MSAQEVLSLIQEGPRSQPAGWHRWLNVQEAHRLLFSLEVERLLGIPSWPTGAGHGIVTCAGGPKYFTAVAVLVFLLRRLGCTLPIEVWYLGGMELDRPMQSILEELGDVHFRNGHSIEPQPRALGGWGLKPLALVHSRFEHVLYLDADQVPVRDPSYLFDRPEYRDHGAILWPDLPNRWGLDIEEAAFRVSGLPVPGRTRLPGHSRPSDYTPIESGQVLVNRSTHWRELLLASHITERSDFWFRDQPWLIYGDKSAFYLAFQRLGSRYWTAKTPGWTGSSRGGAFLQYDPGGQLLFQHRCQPGTKWSLHESNQDSHIMHWNTCMEALAWLRQRWTGKVYDHAMMDREECARAEHYHGEWVLAWTDRSLERVSLLAGGGTEGAGFTRWCLTLRPGQEMLTLSKGEAPVWQCAPKCPGRLDGPGASLVRPPPPGWEWEGQFELEVYGSIVMENEYQLPEAFQPGDVVVDIGAHVGFFAHACLMRGAECVHAVEPDPHNFTRLSRNLRRSWPCRFVLWPRAAWRADQDCANLALTRPMGGHHSGGGTVLEPGAELLGEAQTASIDTILAAAMCGRRIRLLKLDCEGAEFPILATSTLLQYVDEIVGEYHLAGIERADPRLLKGLPGFSLEWLALCLQTQGFIFTNMPNPVAGLGWFWARTGVSGMASRSLWNG